MTSEVGEDVQAVPAAAAGERRRHKRVALSLRGRYMLPDKREFPCQVLNISAGGMMIACPEPGEVGDRIIAYIDEVGRLEGVVTRVEDNAAAIEFRVPRSKQERIVETLIWLKDVHSGHASETRRHHRIKPDASTSRLTLPDGSSHPCQVIDISMGGANLRVQAAPDVGATVMLGKMRARVVRVHGDGVAIQFLDVPQTTIVDHFG